MIKKIVQLLLILISTGSFGQVVIVGQIKDYHTQENLPFITIQADSVLYNQNFIRLYPPDTAISNGNGAFTIRIQDSQFSNLTFHSVGCVPFSVTNIPIKDKNQRIDIGVIYLPEAGFWFEGYSKQKAGKDRRTRREESKAWKKQGIPNYSGLSNDFLLQFNGTENANIEYPLNGPKKHFKLENGILNIEYSEFIRE